MFVIGTEQEARIEDTRDRGPRKKTKKQQATKRVTSNLKNVVHGKETKKVHNQTFQR
jgi:hypothetical protein